MRKPAIPRMVAWFLHRWPGRRWRTVVRQYGDLGQLTAVLADIAQRGGIYSTALIRSEREAAFAEGRRSLALEIIALAKANPDTLRNLIETYEGTPSR